MARHQAPEPNEFARLVADAIDRELGVQRWSGRELARRLGKSEGYVRERRNRKYEWTLNDLEEFCELIGQQPDLFIARIEADEEFRARFEKRRANVVPVVQPEDSSSESDDYALAASDRPDYETEQEREQEQA